MHPGAMRTQVTDWLPTLVVGAAGVPLGAAGRPCPTCTRPVAPLDGVNQWPMLHTAAFPSARTEVAHGTPDAHAPQPPLVLLLFPCCRAPCG